ncbi:hypothetical protein S96127_2321 [Yersinia pestis]|nr:hypothetical protein S96127_2321 [Yersinia pestis]
MGEHRSFVDTAHSKAVLQSRAWAMLLPLGEALGPEQINVDYLSYQKGGVANP